MEAIKDTILTVIKGLQEKKTVSPKSDPELLLKKVLTKKELEHIKFNYFRHGIIGISVDSSSWLYSLSLKKEGLLAKLTKKSSAIKDINFRIGEVR